MKEKDYLLLILVGILILGQIIMLWPYWEAEPVGSYSIEHKQDKPTLLLAASFAVVGTTRQNRSFNFRCAETGKILAICKIDEKKILHFDFPQPPSPDIVLIKANENPKFVVCRKTSLLTNLLWKRPTVYINFEAITGMDSTKQTRK